MNIFKIHNTSHLATY